MFSTCKHHLLPFHGTAHVAYIPTGKVYGLSKLARLVDCFACRLQTQEEICRDVATALDDASKGTPYHVLGTACVIEATHLCMCSRGVRKPGATTVTSYTTRAFRENPEARAELMQLIFGRR